MYVYAVNAAKWKLCLISLRLLNLYYYIRKQKITKYFGDKIDHKYIIIYIYDVL
jgi:hypothetical protein